MLQSHMHLENVKLLIKGFVKQTNTTKQHTEQAVTCASLLESLRAMFVAYHLYLWPTLRALGYVPCLLPCIHRGFFSNLINPLIVQAVTGVKEGYKHFSVPSKTSFEESEPVVST